MVDARLNTVIIGVDGSPQADQAIQFYLSHLRKPNDFVVFSHCIEIPYQPVQPLRAEVMLDITNKARADAKPVDEKCEQLMRDSGIKGMVEADFGRPGEFLVELARNKNASMIVMGTRGMGKIRRTILGSVSDYVLHHAHCPIMICKN